MVRKKMVLNNAKIYHTTLTFTGWVKKRLSVKDIAMEMIQFIERSFPYFNPYNMVKYPDTTLVPATRSQPTYTNHQGKPFQQDFFLSLVVLEMWEC